MNYTATFYLKSGAIVPCKLEIESSATEQEVAEALDVLESMINAAIKNKSAGAISLNHSHINVQEISAYTILPSEAPQ